MSDNAALIREKLDQAVNVLQEQDIDAWMTFVRETSLTPDPALELILGADMVWQSAFIVTQSGERIAIVGKHDAENVHATGGYTQVIPYLQGPREAIVETLVDLDPKTLALNYSENDVASDGLGHGLMRLLQSYLSDTDFADRFVSAEGVIGALRGRKSDEEIARVKQAITTTQGIFKATEDYIEHGMTEVQVADFVHNQVNDKHLTTSWDWDYCPTFSCGPESPIGHAGPLPDYKVAPGMLLHMDFGVRENDYCADLQRIWYVLRDGENAPPEPVQRGFEIAREALLAGFAALKPGALGWEVDAAARAKIVELGAPEYPYAFGHHVGRRAHDGATVLGPQWERYGQTPFGVIEAGNVFAIELGLAVEGYGYVGLEENVLVTDSGAQWLSDPQENVWLIK